MRYAVTGAAGFVGSHLAEALGSAGHDVVGIDCLRDFYDLAIKEESAAGIELWRLDLAEDPLEFEGFDGVFHLAAQPSVKSSPRLVPFYLRDNVVASQRVFEAAARAGVRVVLASSSSIYGAAERYPTPEDTPPQPLSVYGVTKLAAEHLARAHAASHGLDAVILRYFNAFGPRQRPDMAFTRIAIALSQGSTFELYGDGRQSRGWTYVSDLVDATITAMERGEGTYNVGGAVEASLAEAIQLFERIAGRALAVRRLPAVPGDQRRTAADTSRISAELGWRPRSTLEDGIRAQLDWVTSRVPLLA